MKKTGKRVLSIVLSVLMCLTVFALDWSGLIDVSPEADAATAGKYKIAFCIYDKDNGCENITNVTISYKTSPNNGQGTQSSTTNYALNNSGAPKNTLKTGKAYYIVHADNVDFPTEIYYWARQGKFAGSDICARVFAAKAGTANFSKSNTSGWTEIVGEYEFLDATTDGVFHSSDSGSHTFKTSDGSIKNKPVATSISAGTGFSDLSKTAKEYEAGSITFTAAATVKDQYGVNWYQAPIWSITDDNWGSVSCTGTSGADSTTVTIPATSKTTAVTNFKLKATRGNATLSKTITVTPTYRINFNSNGGAETYDYGTKTNTSNSSTNVSYTIPSTYKPTKSTTNGEYTVTWAFAGWGLSASAQSGTAAGNSVNITNYNQTLYAVFSKKVTANYTYYSTAETTYGKKTTDAKDKTGYNTATQVSIAVPSPADITVNDVTFHFKGWVESPAAVESLPTMKIAKGTTSITRDIRDEAYNYYAVYESDEIALSYNLGKNKADEDATSATDIETQTQTHYLVAGNYAAASADPATTFTFEVNPDNVVVTRPGAEAFLGWRTDGDSLNETAEYENGDEITITENTTLTATFLDHRYPVKFYDYAGATLKTESIRHGYNATAPVDPPYSNTEHPDHSDDASHYVFSYWRLTDDSVYTDAKKILSPLEVYAVYSSHQHVWDKERDQIANCTTSAIFDANCTVCGYHIYEVIPPKGHDWYLDGRVEATCLRAGNNGKAVCRACGNAAYDQYFVKDGDKYVLATATTDGAFKADGKPTPPAGHKWIEEDGEVKIFVNEGTCTVAGYKYKKCDVCEAEEITERLGMQPHGYNKGLETVAAKPATCTEDGHNEYSICKDCGAYTAQPVVIPAKGHDLKHFAAIPATCVMEGNVEYWFCANCRKYFSDAAATAEIAEEDVKLEKIPHTYVETEAEEATCTTPGHTAGIVCTVCGDIPEGSAASETTPAKGHVWEREGFAGYETLTVVDTKEATCTEKGYTEYKCAECDATVKVETDMIAHNLTHMEAKDASCKEEGNIEAWHCEVCDKYFEDEAGTVEIDESKVFLGKTAHQWEAKEGSKGKEATCTEDGYTPEMVCAVCGEEKASEPIPATGHVRTDWIEVTPATCTEGGSEILVCRACRETLDERTTEAKGHTIEEVAAKDATCVDDGNKAGEVCTVCGYIPEGSTYTVIPATGEHTFVTVSEQAATCAHVGKKYESCAVCGEAKVTETPKLAHGEIVDVVTAREATCTAIGTTAGKKCAVCGEIIEQPQAIAKKAHTPEAIRDVSATCTSKGITGRVRCSTCGKMLNNGTTTDMLRHDWSEWVRTDPTCTEPGSNIRECAYCHKYDKIDIAPLGHQVVTDEAVAATCTETGLTEGSHCSRCGEVIEAQTATDAIGHDYEATVTAPTCTEEGYTTHTCKHCGDTYTDTTTDALDHAWTRDESRDVAPTCLQPGSNAYVCTRCGERKREAVEKIEHIWTGEYQPEPTCTTPGVYVETCEMCGEQKETAIDPLGHDYDANGVCTRCGEAKPDDSGSGSVPTPSDQGSSECPKCGLNHNGRSMIWKEDGLICKIVAFFRNIFKIFSR